MAGFEIKVITDLQQAEALWRKFSPNTTLYDTWEFRFCFYKYYNYPLRFYVGYHSGEPVGLLPLQYNSDKNFIEFFGTYFMETNQVFVAPGFEQYIPRFFEQLKSPAQLECFNGQDPFTSAQPLFDYKYFLDLKKYAGFSDYLAREFSGKSRANLKKKITQIEVGNNMCQIDNCFEDIELLFKLNIESFEDKAAAKGGRKSAFLYPHRQDIFRDLLHLPILTPLLTTYLINDQKEAVSLTLRYNGWYIFLNTGANLRAFDNLGTYTYYKNIERAFELNETYFDAGVEAYSWKERFHLDKIPQHQFKVSLDL